MAMGTSMTDYFDRDRFERLVDPVVNQITSPALLASGDYEVRAGDRANIDDPADRRFG